MELFGFLRWFLIIVLSVNLLPTCIPMAALALKMQHGQRPIDMETGEFWIRSALVGVGLAILSAVLIFADWLLAWYGLPPGFLHLVVLMIYLPAAIWYILLIFGLDEVQDGIVVFLLYTALPAIFLVVCVLIGFHLPVLLAESWLLPPT